MSDLLSIDPDSIDGVIDLHDWGFRIPEEYRHNTTMRLPWRTVVLYGSGRRDYYSPNDGLVDDDGTMYVRFQPFDSGETAVFELRTVD